MPANSTAKSDKRLQTDEVYVRMLPEEKVFLAAAADEALARLKKQQPGAKLGLSNFVKDAAMKTAEGILGMGPVDWVRQARPRRKEGR